MALRQIRVDGDPLLRKKSREITKIDDRIKILLDDMVETMYDANGVGLAAPQVGILRRCVVIDVGQGPVKMINPVIVEKDGSDVDIEGCLSIPGFNATVERPERVKAEYTDENGERQEVEAEGLFARAICHELDHLDGVLFKDIYIDEVDLQELMEANEA